MLPVNNDDLDTVGKLWQMVERGGMSFLLFLATIYAGYLLKNVISKGANDLKGQNEEIKEILSAQKAQFKKLDEGCIHCHLELVRQIELSSEFSKERHALIKQLLLEELRSIRTDLSDADGKIKEIISKQDLIATTAKSRLQTIIEKINDIKGAAK